MPFDNGKLMLGTWQQVVVIDFDNRPRRLNLVTQMIGE
ncbi:MAG TPA: YjbQ family protein [Candidatus Brocadiaceae bacterium]